MVDDEINSDYREVGSSVEQCNSCKQRGGDLQLRNVPIRRLFLGLRSLAE